VTRGKGEREVSRVRALARDLGADEGVLIFPEGARFTEARREAIIDRLDERGETEALERARSMKNVLPPRLGGPIALLDEMSGHDVVLCAHVGFEGTMRLSDFVSGEIIGAKVRVEFFRFPKESVPQDEKGRIEWLYQRWRELDDWVELHSSERPADEV
jgi:hypothetical protein